MITGFYTVIVHRLHHDYWVRFYRGGRPILCRSFVQRHWGILPKEAWIYIYRGPWCKDGVTVLGKLFQAHPKATGKIYLWQGPWGWCEIHPTLDRIIRGLKPDFPSVDKFYVCFRLEVNGKTIKPKTHETQKNRNRARP